MAALQRVAAGFIVYRVIQREIQYLMLQTSYGKHHWTPPKGHVDAGEDEFQTAVRETREESGLVDKDLRVNKAFKRSLSYPVNGALKVVHYWLAEAVDPYAQITLSDEHVAFEWAGLTRAKQLAAYADLQGLLDEAEVFLKN